MTLKILRSPYMYSKQQKDHLMGKKGHPPHHHAPVIEAESGALAQQCVCCRPLAGA